MSVEIHPTAIVNPKAELGTNVKIGPYCIVNEDVKIGDATELTSHVFVDRFTTIGSENIIHQFSSIGTPPQDNGYKGEFTELIIGNKNVFREGCNVHRATTKQDLKTIIGNENLFMSAVHIAHDCVIGNNVILASGTACAGHVKVGDYSSMGGQCGVTPFVTVGKGCFIGGASAVDRDVPHFTAALGNRIRLKGVNIIGLRRRGYNRDMVSEVVEFYRMMEASALSPRAFVQNKDNMEEFANNEVVQEFSKFILESDIGLPPFMS